KIQRSQLKAQLESGEFDSALKQAELEAGGANVVPNWFFRRSWIRKEAPAAGPVAGGDWLLFADNDGLSEALRARLTATGARVATVTAGERFAALGDAR